MKTTKILIAALLACVFAPALGEKMGFEEQPPVERRIVTRSAGDMHAGVLPRTRFADP